MSETKHTPLSCPVYVDDRIDIYDADLVLLARGVTDTKTDEIASRINAHDALVARVAELEHYADECAHAIGVEYAAEGHATLRGPLEDVVRHIKDAVRDSGELIDARNNLKALSDQNRLLRKQVAELNLREQERSFDRTMEQARAALALAKRGEVMCLEHENIWCPACEGRGFCIECADGLTMEAYEEVQAAYHLESELERAESQTHEPEELSDVG